MEVQPLMFMPFSSQIALGFWHKLSDLKLNFYKLSEQPVEFRGQFNIESNLSEAVAIVDGEGFCSKPVRPLDGTLLNKNSVDSFRACDKMSLLKEYMELMVSSIKDGEALKNPSLLNCMILLSFADLKKYHFLYWCAFPSASIPNSQFQLGKLRPIGEAELSADTIQRITEAGKDKNAFLVSKSQFKVEGIEEIKNTDDVFVAFADPSGSEDYPGWPLRNLLLAVAFHMPKDSAEFDVICLRGTGSNFQKSKILRVRLNKVNFEEEHISYVGWEKNDKGHFMPKMYDLSKQMHPHTLAEEAVDLNLKLMKWRLAPDINLQTISDKKCLILGSGTLGCNVARCLMAWGVRRITFVDNSKVSLSNPIRQSLFTFEDSQSGGRHKAEAAAENAKKIFPRLVANHEDLTIPMPGHSVSTSNEDNVRQNVEKLDELVACHDVIFLLLDTREARWLPTLMGAAKGKIVINAALGFDTFLVMRHGSQVNKLGCYFCNDVVGPTNSTRDRTLDQQCTVSRPGMSFMAASLAVELLASLLQHSQAVDAPSEGHSDEIESTSSTLGMVPHQIRCFLARYHFMTPSTEAFSMCTACSPKVVAEYNSKGFDFLIRVFNENEFLENFTGLTELQKQTENIDIVALDDSENDLSM